MGLGINFGKGDKKGESQVGAELGGANDCNSCRGAEQAGEGILLVLFAVLSEQPGV